MTDSQPDWKAAKKTAEQFLGDVPFLIVRAIVDAAIGDPPIEEER